MVGDAANGLAALSLAVALVPDVLVLNINLSGPNGVEVARLLRAAESPVRVLAFSEYDDAEHVRRLLPQEAAGCLGRGNAPEDLVPAIRAVVGAERNWCSQRVAGNGSRRGSAPGAYPGGAQELLTPREREVLRLVALGWTNREIAALMSLSLKTVENKLTNILAKLQVHDRAGAVVWAHQHGVVSVAGTLA